MSDEDNDEIHMIMNKKSRFSRYRDRVRERKQLDTTEMMSIDDLNNTAYASHYFP